MDCTRQVAVRLARMGELLIEQKKSVVDPDKWDAAGRRGIVRLRAVLKGSAIKESA